MGKTYRLRFRWGTSRGRDTYGYAICTLFVDGRKVSSCNGGNYDMKATSLGLWVASAFAKELNEKIKEEHYGLSFHDPHYDPGKEVIDGDTIEKREKDGKSLGLERYQAVYSASSKVPTARHTAPYINGMCGWSSVGKIIQTLGGALQFVGETSKDYFYLMQLPEVDND